MCILHNTILTYLLAELTRLLIAYITSEMAHNNPLHYYLVLDYTCKIENCILLYFVQDNGKFLQNKE